MSCADENHWEMRLFVSNSGDFIDFQGLPPFILFYLRHHDQGEGGGEGIFLVIYEPNYLLIR